MGRFTGRAAWLARLAGLLAVWPAGRELPTAGLLVSKSHSSKVGRTKSGECFRALDTVSSGWSGTQLARYR